MLVLLTSFGGNENKKICLQEFLTFKDYDKNNSANTTITTDDTTANIEGETESVYKEEGTTTPTATVSRTGSSSPIQAMRSKLKLIYSEKATQFSKKITHFGF